MSTHVIGFAYNLLDPLLGENSQRNLTELDQVLPWVRIGVFESRLGPQARRSLDFSIGIVPEDAPVIHHLSPYLLQKIHAQNLDWQPQTFLEAFIHQATPLKSQLKSLWIEFDTTTDPQQVILDGCYFEPIQTPGLANQALKTLLQLRGKAFPRSQMQALETCLTALPSSALLNYLGLMVGRNMQLKCCLLFFSLEDLESYLTVLKILPATWPQLKIGLAQWANYWVLNLAIDKTLLPRFGIECYASEDHPDPRRFWEQAFMEMNLQNLANWSEALACLAWNEAAPASARSLGNQTQINHLKLMVEASGEIWAKIYLSFTCQALQAYLPSGTQES